MQQHKTYSITDAEQFNANNYSTIKDEIAFIVKQTEGMLPAYKDNIIISYLKDHAILTTWITANPVLAELMTSNVLPASNIEALFDASRTNLIFRNQFEAYFKNMFHANTGS